MNDDVEDLRYVVELSHVRMFPKTNLARLPFVETLGSAEECSKYVFRSLL